MKFLFVKTKSFITFTVLFTTLATNAQMRVDSCGHVGIVNSSLTLEPRLSVGQSSFFNSTLKNIGIASTPKINDNMYNIGMEGVVEGNTNYSTETNIGVRGLIYDPNTNHGRNYGVFGVIAPTSGISAHGGAGIYGSTSLYSYYNPNNITGLYAGYFEGQVKLTGDLTANAVYTTSDLRLKHDVVSLTDIEESPTQTLNNVLSMNVVEYSYK